MFRATFYNFFELLFSNFSSYFLEIFCTTIFWTILSKRRVTTSAINEKRVSRWCRFEPRENQTLAPIVRRHLDDSEKIDLENHLSNQTDKTTILVELKTRKRRTRPGYTKRSKRDDDCLLVNTETELDLAIRNVRQFVFFSIRQLDFRQNFRFLIKIGLFRQNFWLLVKIVFF